MVRKNMATSNFYQMKKVSYRSKLTAYCLSISAYFFFLLLTSHASVYGELLVQEWGVLPQSAGFIAAESWGIAPKSSSKNIVAFYQNQRVTSYIGLLEDNQNLLPAIGEIAMTPKNQLPPADGMPIVQGFCEIRGEVSDDRLNPVKGVAIELLGSGKTTETDGEGKFFIPAAPSGNIAIEASKIGYVITTQSATALPGQLLTMRISLKEKSADGNTDETMMEEETIVGEYQESTNSGDFNLSIDLETPKLTATMGREEFAKTGVSDAGEAIGKVSGANIVDGKYAVVRGLADRYVTTTFNGAQIASADPSRKAVQLDLFPTSAIEAIKVDKTYSANLTGDFGGGAIDIATRSFPKERILSVQSKITYNDSVDNKMYVHPNHDMGIFGKAGDTLPKVLENKNPDGSVNFIDGSDTTPEDLTSRWRKMHESQSLKPKEADAELGTSQALTYGETFDLKNGMKLGVMTAFSRSTGDFNNSSDVTNQTRNFLLDEYTRTNEWAAYVSVGLEINENNKIQATYFNKHIAEDNVSNATNIFDDQENLNYGNHLQNSNLDPANDYGPDAIYYGASWDVNPLTRDLQIYQISGEHKWSERGAKITWSNTISKALESRPHSTHFEYGILDFSREALAGEIVRVQAELDSRAIEYARLLRLPNPETYNWQTIKDPMYARPNTKQIYDNYEASRALIIDDTKPPVETLAHGTYSGSVPGKQIITRRSESTAEDATNSQIAGTIPFYFSKTNDDNYFEFGLGTSSLKKTRVTTARQYDLVLSLNGDLPGFTPGALEGPGGLGEQLANNPDLIADYFNGTYNSGPYYIDSLTRNGLENISTRLDQQAYFYSGSFHFGKTYFTGGVRIEKEDYDIDISGIPLSAFTDDQIDSNGWENRDGLQAILPTITTGTSLFNDKLSFLLAWSQTVSRPTFWEFIPSQSLDQASGIGRRGNNQLGQTEISNFDFATIWQANENTTFRMSLFHKNLVRPLVSYFQDGVIGYGDAYIDPLTGASEDYTASINGIEVEAEIANIGPFSLKGNFTYIDAVLNYFNVQGTQAIPVSSQLPFQPSFLANFVFGYSYDPWALTANLVYNYNGDYPTILKLTPTDREVSRQEIHTFDLVLSKGIETDGVDYTIRAGVKNIFNAQDTYLLGDDTFSNDSIGRSYWTEIQIAF